MIEMIKFGTSDQSIIHEKKKTKHVDYKLALRKGIMFQIGYFSNIPYQKPKFELIFFTRTQKEMKSKIT